jgi:hypothetical protein
MAGPYNPISQAGVAGTATLVAGKTGNRIRLLGLFGTMTANGTAQIRGSVSGAITGVMTITGGAPLPLGPCAVENGEGICETNTAGEDMQLLTTGSGFNGGASFQYIPA